MKYPKSKWFAQVICKIHQATVDFGVPTFLGVPPLEPLGCLKLKPTRLWKLWQLPQRRISVMFRGEESIGFGCGLRLIDLIVFFPHLLSSSIIFYLESRN